MNWKLLLPLPLAALWLGQPLRPPHLKPPLSPSADACLSEVLHQYLQSYAYSRESPRAARLFLWSAENQRLRCDGDTSVLEERIRELRASLP